MVETMHRFWESVIAPADAGKDDRVISAEVVQAFASAFADRFFDLADGDGDGAIRRTEFTRIFASSGRASDEECAEVFNALDLDSSGALSRAEYHKGVRR